jgi:hypothetical protein
MSDRHQRDKKPPGTTGDDRHGAEILLRAEVAFWREMIGSCDADHPPASLERMQQALALAEYRLLRCFRADIGPAATTGGPGGTSDSGSGFLH